MSADYEVIHDEAQNAFTVAMYDRIAHLDYRTTSSGRMKILHTLVPREMGGMGVAASLARAALAYAEEHEMIVVPYCPFVQAYLKRHPELATRLIWPGDDTEED